MRVTASSLEQQLSLSIRKYTNEQIQRYKNLAWEHLENGVDAWKEQVQDALSIPIPHGMEKKRTMPRDRLFPYLRGDLKNKKGETIYSGGQLMEAVQATMTQRKGREGTFTFALIGKIDHEHAYRTTIGSNSDRDAGWIGWRDDVLSGDGRGNIKSLKEIFTEIKQMRRG